MDWLTTSVRPPYALMSPWMAIILTQAVGFLGVLCVRQFLEGQVYLLRWWSFRFGDSVAIGVIYAFFASLALRDYEASGWYTTRLAYILLVVIGLGVGIFLLKDAITTRKLTYEDVFNSSELYHTFVTWPGLFLLVGSALIPVWANDTRLLYKLGMTLGLVLYLAAVGYDMFLNPHRGDPGR